MNVYDKKVVERVWVRVRRAQRASQQRAQQIADTLSAEESPGKAPDAGQVPEELLVEWISRTLAMERSYETMARQRKELSPLFRRLAREEQEAHRRLMGLRFLLYGRNNPVISGAAEGARVFGAALRNCYMREAAARLEFAQAAERWPRQGELLRTLAEKASRHSLSLEQIARRLTGNQPHWAN